MPYAISKVENVNASEIRKNHINIFPQLTLKGETPPRQADCGLFAATAVDILSG